MKRKGILLCLMLLVMTFAFGQKSMVGNHKDGFIDNKYNVYAAQHKLDYTIVKLDNFTAQILNGVTNQLEVRLKQTYSYDINGNRIEDIFYSMDQSSNQWVAYLKYEYTFNANGNNIQDISYEKAVSTSQWIASEKIDRVFNSNGKMIEYKNYNWNESVSEWIVDVQEEYNYNNAGDIIKYIHYHWDVSFSHWVVDFKTENAYNASGDKLEYSKYNWNQNSFQWEIDSKEEYTYDANNLLVESVHFQYLNFSVGLIFDVKSEYTYDENGNKIQDINYRWNRTAEQWFTDSKKEYSYDANGNPTLETKYEFMASTNEYIPNDKKEYSYDLLSSVSDLVMPPYVLFPPSYSDQITNKPTGYLSYYWDVSINDWKNNIHGVYNYVDQIVPVNEIETQSVTLYPNPASDYVSISLSAECNRAIFELFDMQGRKLMVKEVSNNEKVNVQKLSSGIYMYNITVNGKTEIGKLVKR